jgi:uncharacterized protein YuzE
MKTSDDSEVDALSIRFRETTVTTKPLGEGIAADDDSEGRLAGLEILDAVRRTGREDTLRHVNCEGLDPAARVCPCLNPHCRGGDAVERAAWRAHTCYRANIPSVRRNPDSA